MVLLICFVCSVLVDTAFVHRHALTTNNIPVFPANTGNVIAVQSYQPPLQQQQQQYQQPPPVHQPAEIAYIASMILGILWWYVLILLAYQTFLVATGATGYECVKGKQQRLN